jgi:hypothetical protein
VALPYNDVTRGTTKPEARRAIPWFKQAFERPGKSVLKGRWVAIKRGAKICYAQWEDVGPSEVDDFDYVFGAANPRNTFGLKAGLDVSPAVWHYLGMDDNEVTAWRFADVADVPSGPWTEVVTTSGNNRLI